MVYPCNRALSAIKRRKLLTHTTEINLENERSQTQKSAYCMNPFVWNSIRCQLTCSGRRQKTSAYPGLGEGAERQSRGTGDFGGWRKNCASWRCGGHTGVDRWTKNATCSRSKQRMWPPSSHQPLRLPSSVHPEGSGVEKLGYWLEMAKVLLQEMTSTKPRFLHLPIYRKVLSSLTWDVYFSLINSNFFDGPTTWLLLQKLDIPAHSSTLAWRIPWTEEPGGLWSMGSRKSWTQLSD